MVTTRTYPPIFKFSVLVKTYQLQPPPISQQAVDKPYKNDFIQNFLFGRTQAGN